MTRLRVAVAQLNLLVGDVTGNARRIIESSRDARTRLGADVVMFPELALTGYPPEDLLLRDDLFARVDRALADVCANAGDADLLVGYPHRGDLGVYNACAFIRDGRIIERYFKQHLPNYGVFDEKRYFVEGQEPCVVDIKGTPTALTVCEDIWVPQPTAQAHHRGARLMLNVNASPYHIGKGEERERLLAQRACDGHMAIVYGNLVGGQDELVFDGQSLAVDHDGRVCARARAFEEELWTVDLELGDKVRPLPGPCAEPLAPMAEIYAALVTGVRDYVDKNGFPGALVGLSGGIDSALTLAIAVDALGADRVEAVLMPSRYTAGMSIDDAREEAERLGVRHHIISIEAVFRSFLDSLAPPFAGAAPDTTEENIQARCRGVILMALSNKTGKMLLTTGNKSEVAVGYATLYGDMAGGFAPLKDVYKTDVYRLARWRNERSPVVPERVLERPPSAELAPGQVDQDSLPPYAELDAILERFVERDRSIEQIVAEGFDEATVHRVVRLVILNEYKRRQAAPGVRISRRAFGRDRRYPITSGYRDP